MPSLSSQFEMSTAIDAPAEKLAEWHYREEAISLLIPPWEKVEILQSPGEIEDGARAIMKVGAGPFQLRWVAEHRDCVRGKRFTDIQLEGPFAEWKHLHLFESVTPQTCRLTDRIEYRLPLGILGKVFGNWLVQRKLRRMFIYRHRITKDALEEE